MTEVYTYECFFDDQGIAIREFNEERSNIEQMHDSKIKFLRMYKNKGLFAKGWTVEYALQGGK